MIVREMGAGWCAVAASEPKINDVELRIIGEADEDVVRFDIAMNVATRMNVLDVRYLHKLSAVNTVDWIHTSWMANKKMVFIPRR